MKRGAKQRYRMSTVTRAEKDSEAGYIVQRLSCGHAVRYLYAIEWTPDMLERSIGNRTRCYQCATNQTDADCRVAE